MDPPVVVNLVIQGPSLTALQAQEAALLARTPAIETLAEHAFRLRNATFDAAIPDWCESRRIDHAFMPPGRRFAGLKLLAMDMDSTLITIECIDELGDMAGRKAEIAEITARAMRGEIDYAESLRRRVALLAGLPLAALERVYDQRLRLSPGAEPLLAECRRNGVKVLLVSGGFTFFVERLKERLGIDYAISNVLEIEGGRLSGRLRGRIVDAEAKAARFRAAAQELGAAKGETVAIGDGANDLKMMAEAGVSVAYRAKPVVRAQASCALNWAGLEGVLNLFE